MIDRVATLSQQAQKSRDLLHKSLEARDYQAISEHEQDYIKLTTMIQEEVNRESDECRAMSGFMLGFIIAILIVPFLML